MEARRQINWMGYKWILKDSRGKKTGPGPNTFSPSNSFVDQHGLLHLRITFTDNVWTCAELYTQQAFPYGLYQWQVIGDVDELDKNVVFAMFLYPPSPQIAPDGSNEIDVEFAKWGHDRKQNLDYTFFPKVKGKPHCKPVKLALNNGNYSTHRLIWRHKYIQWMSLHGHYHDNQNMAHEHHTSSNQLKEMVPEIPLRVHMNLWLFKGNAPSNSKEVEVIFKAYRRVEIRQQQSSKCSLS